jgi:valyl-tRNA synthetase
MNEIPSRYDPKAVEDKWYGLWESRKYFSAKPDPRKNPFTIVIPPPNVTGILHMGHALNNTIQDILIRYHRMKGEEALWMPGTDHAGIATQNVVEKSLAREGRKRQDLGRDKFIERVWEWREEYGSTIIRQLKKLGASCDWERLRFTMDEEYSKSVADVFLKLYEKGLIYRGSYIINWCPRCQTALSDEEAPHHDLQGNLYYLKYPLKNNPEEFVVVATTRPETMLGDTAVAVNPKDKRYKELVGKFLILPLTGRQIKIIADSDVDMKFGTGAVKVTPAHDPNDYVLGRRHKLEFINVMHPDARLNDAAGDYRNMDRFEAREVMLEDLKEQGLLDKVEPHALSAGHCYRCHTIIEPYLSQQWFVKMKPLAKPAIEAVKKGKIKFHPGRWTKVYLNWMNNIQDWCISRQIWWGHRLPVYYCQGCDEVIVSKAAPANCPKCKGTDIRHDDDVLDTWFSSWLWPFATFKSREDLKYFYPTSVLVTAPEIIFFWVARMIISGFQFMKERPFSDVYIHGTVRDIEGKKMSKSLGNIIDPLEIIREYGADALRFSLISITAQGQDVFLSKERFEQGRNFANKIWNASRFILMNMDREKVRVDLCSYFKKNDLIIVNRWILSRFYSVLTEVNRYLDAYKFNEAANLLYGFFWHEFCDWYLEMIKSDIRNTENQVVMYKVLEKSLRLLHPFMPFVTEEIWQMLPHEGDSVMMQPWPHIQRDMIDKKTESGMVLFFEAVNAIRNIRTELEVPLTAVIDVKIYSSSKPRRELFRDMSGYFRNLARINDPQIGEHYTHVKGEFVCVLNGAHVVIPLSGVVDIEKYKFKTEGRIQRLRADIKSKETNLANPHFTKKAPEEIVEGEKEKLKNLREALKKLEGVLDGIR